MGQIRWRHNLARALNKRRLALAEPKTWQREASHVSFDVLPSIVNRFLLKGEVVCHSVYLPHCAPCELLPRPAAANRVRCLCSITEDTRGCGWSCQPGSWRRRWSWCRGRGPARMLLDVPDEAMTELFDVQNCHQCNH